MQRTVSEELYNLWVTYNVYPIAKSSVQKRLKDHISEFYRLLNYPKKKMGPKYRSDVEVFLNISNTLFDIYQKDEKKLALTEKNYLLKMAEDDYKFYEVRID